MTKLSSRTAAIAPSTASTMNFRTNRGISSPLSRQVDIEPRLVERELDRMAGAGGKPPGGGPGSRVPVRRQDGRAGQEPWADVGEVHGSGEVTVPPLPCEVRGELDAAGVRARDGAGRIPDDAGG